MTPLNSPCHQSSVLSVFFKTLILSPSLNLRSPSLWPAKSYIAVTKVNDELGIRGGGGGGFFFSAMEEDIADVRDDEEGWRSREK